MKDRMTTTLNERDSLYDLLLIEKKLMGLYTFTLSECVGKGVRKELFSCINLAGESQYRVFEQMDSRGYYAVEEADEETIKGIRERYAKVKLS